MKTKAIFSFLFLLSMALLAIQPIGGYFMDEAEHWEMDTLLNKAREENNKTIEVCMCFEEKIIDYRSQIEYATALINEGDIEIGEGIMKRVINHTKGYRATLLNEKESYVRGYIENEDVSKEVMTFYNKAKEANDDTEKAKYLKGALDEIDEKDAESSGWLFVITVISVLGILVAVVIVFAKLSPQNSRKRQIPLEGKDPSRDLEEKIKGRRGNE